MPIKQRSRSFSVQKATTKMETDRYIHIHHVDPCQMADQSLVQHITTWKPANDASVQVINDEERIAYDNSWRWDKRSGRWVLIGKPWHFNPCHHVRRQWLLGPDYELVLDGHYEYTGLQVWNHEGTECSMDLVEDHQITVTQAMIMSAYLNTASVYWPWSDEWMRACSQSQFTEKMRILDTMAFRSMVPLLDDGFSLPVFLFELKDLRSLFDHAFYLLARLPQMLKNLFNRPLKELSKHWLASIFGWLPFISDCRKLIYKIVNLSKLINRFLDNANKKQTLHWKHKLSPLTFADQAWFNQQVFVDLDCTNVSNLITSEQFVNIGYSVERQRLVVNPVYHATMDFKYKIPYLSRRLARYLAGLDILGVHLSLADLWEVVPFSFVIDWFLGVQSYLRLFDKPNIPVQVVIYDFCRSLRYGYAEYFRNVKLDHVIRYGPTEPAEDHTSHWTASPDSSFPALLGGSYHRWVGVPDLSKVCGIQLRTPKGLQLVSLAALIEQYAF